MGVSGLKGELVRPAFQTEPPNFPKEVNAWAAFRITDRSADTFPYVGADPLDGSNVGRMQRQEQLEVLISFYDLGVDGTADELATLVRDNAIVAQNAEQLSSPLVLAYTGGLQAVPSLLKQRWLYRVDLPVTLRRQIDRDYRVLSVLSADGAIRTDVGIGPLPIEVPEPTSPGDTP